MTSRKYFYISLGTLVFLIVLILAGAMAGNAVLQNRSKKLSSLKVENEAVERQQAALAQAKRDVEKYSELESISKSIVPQDKDQAKTVREIVKIADENNVPIKSVAFQSSTLGDATAPAPAPAEGESSPKTAAPSVSQVKPVEGIPGVYTLEIEVASNGKVSYQNFLKFLDSLEKNRRTAHVTGINVEPDDNGNSLTFNLTLNAYLKP